MQLRLILHVLYVMKFLSEIIGKTIERLKKIAVAKERCNVCFDSDNKTMCKYKIIELVRYSCASSWTR
jgi:hypothetical protein